MRFSVWCLGFWATDRKSLLGVQGLEFRKIKLGRALGHFIFSLIGLKRILYYILIFFKSFRSPT